MSIELALKGTPDVMDVPSTRFEITPLEDDGITVRGRDVIFKPGRKPTFDVLFETEACDVRLFFFCIHVSKCGEVYAVGCFLNYCSNVHNEFNFSLFMFPIYVFPLFSMQISISFLAKSDTEENTVQLYTHYNPSQFRFELNSTQE